MAGRVVVLRQVLGRIGRAPPPAWRGQRPAPVTRNRQTRPELHPSQRALGVGLRNSRFAICVVNVELFPRFPLRPGSARRLGGQRVASYLLNIGAALASFRNAAAPASPRPRTPPLLARGVAFSDPWADSKISHKFSVNISRHDRPAFAASTRKVAAKAGAKPLNFMGLAAKRR